ncbi:MAG: glutaredoxin family protein [Gammaproteobacteria bacterium]
MKLEFIIYSRQGCHLCDVMKDELEAMAMSKKGTIKLVDIDNDPDLKKRFNNQIPVLFVDDVEICHYKLNKKNLLRFLAAE